jgi:glycosyltransferase involved in cell wall biosynthesis
VSDPSPRVAFYYGVPAREPNDQTNPYGNLLVDALERQGAHVVYVDRHDEAWLRENADRFDVMHWHWPAHEYHRPDAAATEAAMQQFVAELRLARELGWRVVWTAHNLYPHDRTYHEINRRFRFEFVRLTTALMAHCDAAADAVRREFAPEAPIFLIPHGNFIDVLPATVTREAERAELGIPPDAFVYGFIGNLLPYKGLEELIDTFRRVDPGDAWLLISGGVRSEYGGHMRAYIADHPRIVLRTYDYAPGEAFVRVLQASDVIVLPFRASTTSGSLVQALSWPRPAIVPAMGCLPTQMDADAGILYPPDDPDGLEDAMRRIRQIDLGAARGAAWRSSVRADWDEIARTTLAAYRA